MIGEWFMKKILFSVLAISTLAACATRDMSKVTDYYAIEGNNTCDTHKYYLAESYKTKNEFGEESKVTTHEYVCLKEGVSEKGKLVYSFEDLKTQEQFNGENAYVIFIPKAYVKNARHLYKN
tara:strand:- start:1991 stop:2356 length:366 start_codon:yes stop_codon:yes gene_type:complete